MTTPAWAPFDDSTADLLSLVADPHPAISADVPALFLAACEADANTHGGMVSVNRVRAALADADIEHHRFSALWSRFTGQGRPMVRDGWETCSGSASGNNGKPYPLRRWVGSEDPSG